MSSRHLARLQRAGAGREGSDEEESSDEGENEDSENFSAGDTDDVEETAKTTPPVGGSPETPSSAAETAKSSGVAREEDSKAAKLLRIQ